MIYINKFLKNNCIINKNKIYSPEGAELEPTTTTPANLINNKKQIFYKIDHKNKNIFLESLNAKTDDFYNFLKNLKQEYKIEWI